jgi:site-specific DNA recombinase
VIFAYLRVSGDEQRERNTIALQKAAIEQWCRTNGKKVDKWYIDDGVTSKIPWAERPDGQKLWADVNAGDEILIWKIDRAARKLVELLTSVDALDQRGVKLTSTTQYVPDGPTGRLFLQVLGAFSEFEKSVIIERTVAGSYTKAADPTRWMGGPTPFGFRKVGPRRIQISAEPTTGHARLKSERAVIEYIFKRIAAGASTRQVADYLNLIRIPAGKRARGAAARWIPARIYNLVREPIYRGMHYYGRRSKLKDAPPPVERPMPQLAIVTPELWEAANAAMKAGVNWARSHTKGNHQYLLTSLIACHYSDIINSNTDPFHEPGRLVARRFSSGSAIS